MSYERTQENLDTRDNTAIRISENCHHHEDEKIVAWCHDHNTGFCNICKENDHSICENIEIFNDSTNGPADFNTNFKTAQTKFRNITKIYKQLFQERESNIESVKHQKVQIRDQIRKLQDDLNNHLMELEIKLIDELDQSCEIQTKRLADELAECKYRTGLMASSEEDALKLKDTGTHLQLFLAAKQAALMATQEEDRIKGMNETIKNYSLEFKLEKAIQDILDIQSLGTIDSFEAKAFIDLDILEENPPLTSNLKKVKTKTSVEHKREGLRWDRTRLKRYRTFNMNTSLDKFLPEITGAVFMPDDTILVADEAYKRLLQIQDRGEIIRETQLTFEPADVALLGDSNLYVTHVNERRVTMFDLYTMEESDGIILPSNGSGISAYEDKLLVIVCEKSGLYVMGPDDSINVVSMRQNEPGPIDINRTTIGYAESKKSMVHAFEHDGKKKFSVRVDGFGYIHGLALLKDSSVLVAKLSPGKHSIVHLSKDGKDKMLRLELNDISAPRSFAVDRKKRRLLIVHGVRKITIFNELK